jgi:hypothetical protein
MPLLPWAHRVRSATPSSRPRRSDGRRWRRCNFSWGSFARRTASTGLLVVARLGNRLDISVVDDGDRGALASAADQPGLGLAGMRERAQVFGGRVEAGPGEGRGWRVATSLSLTELPSAAVADHAGAFRVGT